MNITEWVRCPVCGNKTRLQLRADTELKNFPLYCPKCRQESLIDAKDLRVTVWKEKKVLCVATMGLFSGDGAGCSARLLKRYGAKVVGGLHIHMPDSVCDVKLLKKTMEKNQEIIKAADKKIEKWADKIKNSKYPKDGLYFYDRIAGFICQRFWCYGKTKDYSDKLKINHNCTGCGLCVRLCPMENLMIENNKATAKSRCTMCCRCISSCPQQAITLLGDTIIVQYRYEQYVKE